MNKRDVWLDERIRRGLNAWLPKVPEYLDEGIVRRSLSMKAEPDGPVSKKRGTAGAAIAASLILGALTLWLLGPGAKEPLTALEGLPRPGQKMLVTVPGQLDPVKPPQEWEKTKAVDTSQPIGGMNKRGGLAGTPAGEVPRQIDLQLEIPGKDITIVWCQREDFDLLEGKNRLRR
jgi:hypothetical protein